MRKLSVFLSVIAAMGVFVLFASTARAAMSDENFVELCGSGSLAEIQEAIKGGADANAKGKDGKTALMWAAMWNRNPEVISLLLKNGADVNAKDDTGMTALIWEAFRANPKVISLSLLLRNGADVNAKDDRGVTALMAVATRKSPEAISLLLENGADAAITDNEGKKAIDYMIVPDENSSDEHKSAYQRLKNAGK
jgi:ankyrin repeat protein